MQLDDIRELVRKLAVSESTVWRLVRDTNSGFPQPVKIGRRLSRWDSSQVNAWIAEQCARAPAPNADTATRRQARRAAAQRKQRAAAAAGV